MADNLPSDIREAIQNWLKNSSDESDKKTIQTLLKTDPDQLVDAFHTKLKFGNGGIRALMGVGTNRINIFTVQAIAQGFSDYILTKPKPSDGFSIFIGFDGRNNSKKFAEAAASVFVGNGIKVYLVFNPCPTPIVSFGCRYYECTAGFMITASHNPPEYNGCKIFSATGAALASNEMELVSAAIEQITEPSKIKQAPITGTDKVEIIFNEITGFYISEMFDLQNTRDKNKKNGHLLSIVYSPLNGTGVEAVRGLLTSWGFSNLSYVETQASPHPLFGFCQSPNPEDPRAYKEAIDKALAIGADLVLLNDPDADRIGVAVKVENGIRILNGHEIAVLCLDHILETKSVNNKLPEMAAFVKSFVTTNLFKAICERFKRPCFQTLPGFRHISEKISQWEHASDGYLFLFGAEETHGYLKDTHLRDKDGISLCGVVAELALNLKLQGKTLIDRLNDLYHRHGVYYDAVRTIKFNNSKISQEKIASFLENLKTQPPRQILDEEVAFFENYETSEKLDLATGEKTTLNHPKAIFYRIILKNGIILSVRPSSTESKLKLYINSHSEEKREIDAAKAELEAKAERLFDALSPKDQ